MKEKKQFGQFYTTNSQYIIGNLLNDLEDNVPVVEPFCGNGDLILTNNFQELYDINPVIKNCIKQDTILNPPDYKNKYVITNPPFLHKNKNKDKTYYEKYHVNDLYKAFLKTILDADGGIVILPLNFLCDNDDQIRELFFDNFEIINLNIFEEQVFNDTTYTICSFSFKRKTENYNDFDLNCKFFPQQEEKVFHLKKSHGYKIGTEFFDTVSHQKKRNIKRLKQNNTPNSNLFLRAIDSGSEDGRINLSVNKNHYYGIETDRVFATLLMDRVYNEYEEKIIAEKFNEILEYYREKYHSLFLSTYRNSTSLYSRKRISFENAFKLISYIINNYID